ncbi:MAG: hypothetical protein KKF27_20710, partial [Gammaproteobacteria bacterium]|nr:hypothetical protein [Gammaproteobacteria bacterium]
MYRLSEHEAIKNILNQLAKKEIPKETVSKKPNIIEYFDANGREATEARLMQRPSSIVRKFTDKLGVEYGKNKNEAIKNILNQLAEKETPKKEVTVKVVNGVDAVRTAAKKGKGVDVLRKSSGMHYGNPFSELPKKSAPLAKVRTKTVEESVNRFKDWLEGKSDQKIEPKRREWILNQIDSGALTGKTLLYYKNIPYSHADVLAEFANNRISKKEIIPETKKETAPKPKTKKVKSESKPVIEESQDELSAIAKQLGIDAKTVKTDATPTIAKELKNALSSGIDGVAELFKGEEGFIDFSKNELTPDEYAESNWQKAKPHFDAMFDSIGKAWHLTAEEFADAMKIAISGIKNISIGLRIALKNMAN